MLIYRARLRKHL